MNTNKSTIAFAPWLAAALGGVSNRVFRKKARVEDSYVPFKGETATAAQAARLTQAHAGGFPSKLWSQGRKSRIAA